MEQITVTMREIIERIEKAEMPLLDMAIASCDPIAEIHMRIEDVISLCRNALAAKPDVCVWHRKTDTGGEPYGPWITSCGNEWDLQGPDGNGPFEYPDEYGFEFCPFTGCGRKIAAKE